MSTPDVLIVGGGVVGLTTAYYLAKAGARVQIVERGSALGRESSWAGAGIIPPGNPTQAATTYDYFRARSSADFPGLSAQLQAETGIDNGYRRCGGIEFFNGDALKYLPGWQAEGIAFQALQAHDVQALAPGLTFIEPEAFYFPGMSQVRNPRHLQALIAANRRLGVAITTDCEIVGVARTSDRLAWVSDQRGEDYRAGQFLFAPGAWAPKLLGLLDLTIDVYPVKGQIALLKTPQRLLTPVVCCEKLYIVPRDDGRLLVGSTEEPEAGYEKVTTADRQAELIAFAEELLPGLRGAEREAAWAGLRPGSKDNLPYLGAVPGLANAFCAAGHYRAGIQLSPVTGRSLANLLLGQPLECSLDPFRVDRVPGEPFISAFRS